MWRLSNSWRMMDLHISSTATRVSLLRLHLDFKVGNTMIAMPYCLSQRPKPTLRRGIRTH